LRFALAPPARCRFAAAKWRFGRVPRPRGRLQADRFRIPRAGRAGALLLSARKQMQKGHPRVAFFTFVFLARGGFEPPIGYEPVRFPQQISLDTMGCVQQSVLLKLSRNALLALQKKHCRATIAQYFLAKSRKSGSCCQSVCILITPPAPQVATTYSHRPSPTSRIKRRRSLSYGAAGGACEISRIFHMDKMLSFGHGRDRPTAVIHRVFAFLFIS